MLEKPIYEDADMVGDEKSVSSGNGNGEKKNEGSV